MSTLQADNAIRDFGLASEGPGGLAIVTGGASGIGEALVERAVAGGLTGVIIDINERGMQAARDRISAMHPNAAPVICVTADVGSLSSMQRAASQVAAAHPGKPIALVCANAGKGGEPLLTCTEGEWKNQMDVCMNSVLWTVRAFLPQVLDQVSGKAPREGVKHGMHATQKIPCAFVATVSVAGLITYQESYSVSKKGALAIMETLRLELGDLPGKPLRNLHFQVLCPGITKTGITKATPFRDTIPDRAFGSLLDKRGMPPAYVAEKAFAGIREGIFCNVVDHWEQDMNVGAQQALAQRHRALESGKAPERFKETGFRSALFKEMKKIYKMDKEKNKRSRL